jgi:hypothetical protein
MSTCGFFGPHFWDAILLQNAVSDDKDQAYSKIFDGTTEGGENELDSPAARFQVTAKFKTDTNQKEKKEPQDRVFAEIKSSAMLSLGKIEHSNFFGWLGNRTISFKERFGPRSRTYTTGPSSMAATLTGISWPFSSFAFVTLNTESTDEVTMNIVASAK